MRNTLHSLVLALATGCLSCRDDRSGATGREQPPVERSQTRRYDDAGWDTVFAVRSSLNDTLLVRPLELAAGINQLFVVDVGRQRILAFDSTGQLMWSFGGKGRGPSEFQNIFDVEVNSEGNLWVSDDGLSRVTVMTPQGTKKRIISTSLNPHHIAVVDSTTLISTVVARNRFFVIIDSAGTVTEESPVPLARYQSLDARRFQMFTAADPTRGLWALASPFVSEFFVYRLNGEGPVCVGNQAGIPEDTPVLVQETGRPRVWMYSLSASDGLLFALARGGTTRVRETVDVYGLNDCRYRLSYVLPRQATSIASRGSTLFVTYEDSVEGTGVLALRRTP